MKKKQYKKIALQALIHSGYLLVCFLGIFPFFWFPVMEQLLVFNEQIEGRYELVQQTDLPNALENISFAKEMAQIVVVVLLFILICFFLLYLIRGVQYKEWKKNALVCVLGFFLFGFISLLSIMLQVYQPILFSTGLMTFISYVCQILMWGTYFFLFVYTSWWVRKKIISFSKIKVYLIFFLIVLLPVLLAPSTAMVFLSTFLFVLLQSYATVIPHAFVK